MAPYTNQIDTIFEAEVSAFSMMLGLEATIYLPSVWAQDTGIQVMVSPTRTMENYHEGQ